MSPPAICIPPKATIAQLRLVVIKYLKDHPTSLHYDASSEVYGALEEGFPCPKTKPPAG